MKALSGRQPWWWAILHAGKRIENRVWNTQYRGPILLHAAKGCTAQEYYDATEWMVDAGVVLSFSSIPPLEEMDRGGIVGRAQIIGVVTPVCLDTDYPIEIDRRWHMTKQFGFVLADIEPLPFFPCRGALGLFEVPYPSAER